MGSGGWPRECPDVEWPHPPYAPSLGRVAGSSHRRQHPVHHGGHLPAGRQVGSSAFSIFFTQSPSFLSFQRTMQQAKGRNNAQSLFQVEQIPSDNHIRQTLDPVPPETLFPVYDAAYEALREHGVIESFRAVHDTVLIALDGTWYSSSQKIHCQNCSCLEHKNGEKTYYHSAVTPVIVAPGQPHALALRPGSSPRRTATPSRIAKSCQTLEKAPPSMLPQGHLLGDDIYAHQPFCRRSLLHDSTSSLSANPNRTKPSTTGSVF